MSSIKLTITIVHRCKDGNRSNSYRLLNKNYLLNVLYCFGIADDGDGIAETFIL